MHRIGKEPTVQTRMPSNPAYCQWYYDRAEKEDKKYHRMTYAMYYLSILRSFLDPSEGAMRYYMVIFITKIKRKKEKLTIELLQYKSVIN